MIIVKHTGESAIVSSRRRPIVFLHLGLKFTSDREDLLVEKFILSSLVLFGPCGKGEKWLKNEVIDNLRPFYGL